MWTSPHIFLWTPLLDSIEWDCVVIAVCAAFYFIFFLLFTAQEELAGGWQNEAKKKKKNSADTGPAPTLLISCPDPAAPFRGRARFSPELEEEVAGKKPAGEHHFRTSFFFFLQEKILRCNVWSRCPSTKWKEILHRWKCCTLLEILTT